MLFYKVPQSKEVAICSATSVSLSLSCSFCRETPVSLIFKPPSCFLAWCELIQIVKSTLNISSRGCTTKNLEIWENVLSANLNLKGFHQVTGETSLLKSSWNWYSLLNGSNFSFSFSRITDKINFSFSATDLYSRCIQGAKSVKLC